MYGRGERLKEGRSSVIARGLSRGVLTPVSHTYRWMSVCAGGGKVLRGSLSLIPRPFGWPGNETNSLLLGLHWL